MPTTTSEASESAALLDDLVVFEGFGSGIVDAPAGPAAVLVASTRDQRRQGLMGVVDLLGWDGMWFVMDEPTLSGFWMKDTVMPLSIAFVNASSQVVAVADMEPCVTETCPVYEPGVAYSFALEVPQGMLDDHGIELGSTVELLD